MGSVSLAFDERLERRVALKTIRDLRADDGEARVRFWREARALAALRHPGIVEVYELGEADGALFIAMEYVDGEPLAARLGARWPCSEALEVVRQAASALGAAHAAGLVHRDVKPSNLLIESKSGHLRVIDFGLARHASGDDRITSTGAAVGTPAYMAPEQVHGDPVSPATDVFALGTLLYTLLSGTHPFRRESTGATAAAVAGAIHRPLSALGAVPADVAALVEACLSVSPDARPRDGAQLAERLAWLLAAALEGAASPPGAPIATSDHSAARHGVSGAPNSRATAELVESETGPTRLLATSAEGRSRRQVAAVVAGALGALAVGWAVLRFNDERPASSDAAQVPALSSEAERRAHTLEPSPPPGPEQARDLGVAATGVAADPGRAETAAVRSRPPSDPSGGVDLAPLLPGLQRPVVAVLEFEGVAGPVISEVTRAALQGAPERLVAASLEVVVGNPPGLASLTREGRALGHVDLAVRGRREGRALRVELLLPPQDTPARVVDLVDEDPVRLGRATAAAVAKALGTAFEEPAGIQANADAWAAYHAARLALHVADDAKVSENLAWALRLAPDFAEARALELQGLRAEGRLDDLARRAAQLAQLPSCPERLRDFAAAAEAHARGDAVTALRRLEAHLERWPLDLDARSYLLVVRFFASGVLDLGEVERHAVALLQIAPRNEEGASRLIRALGFRGRGAEIHPLLERLRVSLDDPDIAAEAALFSGRPGAAALFDKALTAEPGNLYAEHMGLAARILDGQCAEATQRALARITRVTTLGRDSNLDWTFSLAHQGLLCDARWDAARALRARWRDHSASGRAQCDAAEARLGLAEGRPAAEVEAELERRLASASPNDRPQLLRTYARVASSRERVDAERRRAEAASFDLDATEALRRANYQAGKLLAARNAWLGKAAAAEIKKLAAEAVLPWTDVRGEGDLAVAVETRMIEAELLDALGEKHQRYEALAALGYPRLWVNDLISTARARAR